MALADTVEQAGAASLEEAVGLMRPWLHDIGWLEALLAAQCVALMQDRRHVPPFRASIAGSARHLVLARTERIGLAVTIMSGQGEVAVAPGGRVHFSGRTMLCRPLNDHLQGLGFAMADRLARATGPVRCTRGATLELDERRETVRILPGARPLILLRAQVAPEGPVFSRIHDVASGAMVASAQADEAHARTLMLLSLLRMQGRTDAVAQFEAALDAPLGVQRWAVMREYLALDTGRALAALRDMAWADVDGAVRALARGTLAKLEATTCPA